MMYADKDKNSIQCLLIRLLWNTNRDKDKPLIDHFSVNRDYLMRDI